MTMLFADARASARRWIPATTARRLTSAAAGARFTAAVSSPRARRQRASSRSASSRRYDLDQLLNYINVGSANIRFM